MIKKRYITRGISVEIPLIISDFIWKLCEKPKTKDYLQIFDIKPISNGISIDHRMEIPQYKREYLLLGIKPIFAKIYVIDDGTHITMMLREEY
ncbi:MAG: DUF960 family protein [Clostridia bacterium]